VRSFCSLHGPFQANVLSIANEAVTFTCVNCGSTFKSKSTLTEHEELHSLAAVSQSDEEEIRVDEDLDSSEKQAAVMGGYFAQYEKGIKAAAEQKRISKSWMEKKLKEVKLNPRGPDTDTKTVGIIGRLTAHFASQKERKVLLCGETGMAQSVRNPNLRSDSLPQIFSRLVGVTEDGDVDSAIFRMYPVPS